MSEKLSDFDIDEVIEHTCWQADPIIAPFVGGFGTPIGRRAAVMAAFAAQEIREEQAARRAAFAMDEGPHLDRLVEQMLRLAEKRHAFDPAQTESQHLIEISRYLSVMAAGWADIIDNDPLPDVSNYPDDDV